MPKKHQPFYASIRPTPSTSNTPPPSTTSTTTRSVNERIAQLRREQASQRRDEVTEVDTARTVPPHLRRLLHLAEVDAPRPKRGNRVIGSRAVVTRGYAGPEAPGSWKRAAERSRFMKERGGGIGDGERSVGRLARWYDAEFKRLPHPRSLIHQCLRTFASNWQDLVEYEQHYLASLPIPLKEALLSYLSLYGNRGDLDSRTFKVLFQEDTKGNSTGVSDDVKFLDLTGLMSENFTLKDLEKSLHRPTNGTNITTITKPLASLSLTSPTIQAPDSWEDEADETPGPVPALPASLQTPFFPNLTRLSLAHPPPTISWTDLLAISPSLNLVTHLSLAYWPRPSTTPNAITASMVSEHGAVDLGGSHFYSELDEDWHEVANILRRFSLNTYCLQWLDLEGCSSWVAGLTWRGDVNSFTSSTRNGGDDGIRDGHLRATQSRRDPDWHAPLHLTNPAPPGPNFNTTWHQLTYLNLSQGWIPTDTALLQTLPAGIIPVRLLSWLRDLKARCTDPDLPASARMEAQHRWEDVVKRGEGRTQADVVRWVEREKAVRKVGSEIQGVRKRGGGMWCSMGYGWGGEGE